MNTLLASFARLTSVPFKAPMSLLLVSGEEAAGWFARRLGRRARVEVAHDRPSASLAAQRSKFDAAVVDLDSDDVWGVVSDLRERSPGLPVLGIVRHESTGIKALLRGIDGVLSRASAGDSELVWTLERAVAERRPLSCAPSCEAAEDAREISTRVLGRAGDAARDYAG